MNLRKASLLLGTALSILLLSPSSEAHWCNDLWGSAYNLVVRPETDTISGSSLNVFVQNNMEYALPSFTLAATASGATIKVTRQTQKVSGTLLPGEKAKFTLAFSGGSVSKVEDIDFSVSFGSSGQSNLYGDGGKAAMIKKNDGTLFPTGTPTGIGQGNGQATQLFNAAVADFGNTNDGLDKLLKLYCAGRASWSSGSASVISSNCPDASTTVCPTTKPGTTNGSKFDYMHLWSAGELAVRRSALGTRAGVLRARLQCGVNDANNGFAGFALMALGYLGEDSGARTFIEGKIGEGGDIGTIAKAAIVLMGNAADLTKYQADLTAGTSNASIFVKAACAAALGIAAKDDAAVTNTLIPLAKWTEPDTSDNGQAIYSAQLLNLVAWDRRGWAPGAGDTGAVSFYGESASGGGGSPGGTGGKIGPTGTGGKSGAGGATVVGGTTGGGGKSGSGGKPGSGGTIASGGTTGSGGTTKSNPPVGSGGTTEPPAGSGGTAEPPAGAGGTTTSDPPAKSGGASGSGGESGEGGEGGSTGTAPGGGSSSGCNLMGRPEGGSLLFIVLGLALLAARRRRS
jgi:hypothetical protein